MKSKIRKKHRIRAHKKKKKSVLPEVMEDQEHEHKQEPLTTESSQLLVISPSSEEPISDVEENLTRARKVLYLSHLSAKFTEIGWQFCLILFLTALTGYQSLVLVSTYGLFTGMVVCMLGPMAGGIVDNPKLSRLYIAQNFILVQNLSVVVATLCCFYLLRMVKLTDISSLETRESAAKDGGESDLFLFRDFIPPFNAKSITLLIALHIFGAIAKLIDQAITVAMERDWIVIMSKYASSDLILDEEEFHNDAMSKDGSAITSSGFSVGTISVGHDNDIHKGILKDLKEKTWLTQTNTTMKQIDLLSKVVAPAVAGIFVAGFDDNDPLNNLATDMAHWYNLSYAAVIIGILNLASLYVEYTSSKIIYDLVPTLSIRRMLIQKEESNIGPPPKIRPLPTVKSGLELTELSSLSPKTIGCGIFQLPESLSLFLEQKVSYGGLALALLYFNVLTFGALMTGYLVWIGVNYGTIGILRGISSAIGLLGTVAFHISMQKYNLAETGMWSITSQFVCLGLCFISLYIGNFDLKLWLLVLGVCLSRVGLWVFDLTITQYMQQEIPEQIRGVIGGVQKSLNSFFDLSTYALGLIFSDPEDFHVLVTFGFTSVGLALLLYFFGIYQRRKEFGD